MKKLPLLCPQEYDGFTMNVTTCSRCRQWDHAQAQCTCPTGSEHLPNENQIPTCPIQDRCQHQIQSLGPCVVRTKGLLCESALVFGGMSRDDAMAHPLGFHADVVASPEEIADYMADNGSSPEEVASYLARWTA